MTRQRYLIGLVLALAVITAACTSGSDETVDAAPPSTTIPSTAAPTTTSTTTTTTLPPGLQPQVLEYRLEQGNIWTHETAVDLTLTTEIIEFDVDELSVEDIGDEANTAITTSMSGEQRTLFLSTENDSYEAVFDLQFDEGTIEMTTGPTVVTETLTAADLGAEDEPIQPAVMNRRGEIGDGIAGAPAVYRLDDSLQNILISFGPVFPTDPVDVGDTWTFAGDEPIYGTLEGEATITDEVEYADGYAFVIEYAITYADVPITLALDEIALYGGAEAQAVVDLATDILAPGEEIQAEIVESTLSGTVKFSPDLGIPVQLDLASTDEFVLTVDGEEVNITIDFFTDATASFTFVEQDEGASFEIANILSQYEADPYLLADYSLTPLMSLYVDDPDPEVWDSVFDVLFGTPTEVAGGFSAVGVSENFEDWVDVFVITNGGALRGHPTLANELIYFWTDSEGRTVDVGGKTAYRATIDDREWLVWNSDTHTYVVVGPRAAAATILETIIDGQNPYMWQQGDCLAFRDFDDSVPFSPFGEYGLRHCSHGHEYEVLYSEILPDGPDDPYPDDLFERTSRACGERFFDYVGVFPLESNIGLIRYRPDQSEWERGARYVACVIYLEDGDGPRTLDTRFDVTTADTSVTFVAGDCLSRTMKVPCTDPHDAEVTAVMEYDAPLDAEYPDFAVVSEAMDETCAVALDDYGVTEGEYEVESGSYTDMLLGWDAGIRRYLCVGWAADENSWNVDIVGSFQGDWEMAQEQFDA